MTKHTRLIALLLCVALLFSIVGCTPKKETAKQPSADPEAASLYSDARAALESATDVTLKLVITTHTTVAGDEFSEQSSQTLTYRAIGTEEAIIALDEEAEFSTHTEPDSDDAQAEPIKYTEIWSNGTVYAALDSTLRFSGPADAEAAAARYTPIVLLDASLYGSITSGETGGDTLITFAEPTAAEAWALPEEGVMTEASGTALVSSKGALKEMNYSLTYTLGPSEITLKVQSKPQDEAKEISVPEDTADYTPIDYIDALRLSAKAPSMLVQADSLSLSGVKSIFCEAGGVMLNETTTVHVHGRKKDTIAKMESGVFFTNYSSMESEELELEDTYLDGRLTSVVNGGLPTTRTDVSWEEIREYTGAEILNGMLDVAFWENVTCTDMGSVYFLEYQLNDNFGNSKQNEICETFWSDPSFLYNQADAYENTDLTGYLSMDKYTGLPVAAGFYYAGFHTLEGENYTLSMQYDQSIEAPAKGAYKEITDRMPEEEEPANKATPLFYHVTGADGQEMWLLGTIHVGDERTAYLPEEIYNAFKLSDALALECDTKAFDRQLEQDEALSDEYTNLIFCSSEEDTLEYLVEEDTYAEMLKLLKATGSYTMNMPYAKPYTWSNMIEMFYLRQGYQLHADQGVEERLYQWAEDLDKDILEVESSMFQVKMLTGFSNELQLMLLEGAMECTAREYWEATAELYELWCAGNEADLREAIADEWDTSDLTEEEKAEYLPLMEEYHKTVDLDRNEGMLEKAIEYLESGDVVFYAVGLAHLLDSTNGLVDTLQEAGYTVEPVTFGG